MPSINDANKALYCATGDTAKRIWTKYERFVGVNPERASQLFSEHNELRTSMRILKKRTAFRPEDSDVEESDYGSIVLPDDDSDDGEWDVPCPWDREKNVWYEDSYHLDVRDRVESWLGLLPHATSGSGVLGCEAAKTPWTGISASEYDRPRASSDVPFIDSQTSSASSDAFTATSCRSDQVHLLSNAASIDGGEEDSTDARIDPLIAKAAAAVREGMAQLRMTISQASDSGASDSGYATAPDGLTSYL